MRMISGNEVSVNGERIQDMDSIKTLDQRLLILKLSEKLSSNNRTNDDCEVCRRYRDNPNVVTLSPTVSLVA